MLDLVYKQRATEGGKLSAGLTWSAVLRLIGVRDDRAVGFAIGLTAHGIGTARALQVSVTAAAFSGLAMGLNALATSVLLPLLWALLK